MQPLEESEPWLCAEWWLAPLLYGQCKCFFHYWRHGKSFHCCPPFSLVSWRNAWGVLVWLLSSGYSWLHSVVLCQWELFADTCHPSVQSGTGRPEGSFAHSFLSRPHSHRSSVVSCSTGSAYCQCGLCPSALHVCPSVHLHFLVRLALPVLAWKDCEGCRGAAAESFSEGPPDSTPMALGSVQLTWHAWEMSHSPPLPLHRAMAVDPAPCVPPLSSYEHHSLLLLSAVAGEFVWWPPPPVQQAAVRWQRRIHSTVSVGLPPGDQ